MNYLVVVSRARMELEAVKQIQGLFGERCVVYCPTYEETRPIKHRKSKAPVSVTKPLYPGYLFVSIRNPNEWPALFSVRAVSGLLLQGTRPCWLEGSVVEQIKVMAGKAVAGEAVAEERPEPKVGDRVVVDEGCFSKVEAVYVGDGFVELPAFGRMVRVKVNNPRILTVKRRA